MRSRRLFLSLLLSSLLAACSDDKSLSPSGKPDKASKPILVEVAQVRRHKLAKKWERPGTLAYRRILRLHTQEEGRITSLPWFEGDRVEQGKILVTLDNELLKAELKKARATRSMAERRVSRLERLRKTKAASEEDLLEAQTELELARAELEILETRLTYTTIEAPFSGIVTHRLAEPGDVKPRNSHLLTIADPDSLVARAPASEQLLADLASDSEILVQLDIPGSAPMQGTLQRIYPTLDPKSRQGKIEIKLTDPPETARAGQFVRVKLTGKARERLLIPYTALRTDRQGEHVYVVRDNRAVRQAITGGARIEDWLEVIEGLQAGDRIVKRGFMSLKSDVAVTVLHE